MIHSKFSFRPSYKWFGSGLNSWRSSLAPNAWLLVLFFAIVQGALAQSTGNISGYVRDSSGAAVAGANVTAVMTEQQTTRTGVTDAEGFYNFVALPTGH
jgi:hypothetical protein